MKMQTEKRKKREKVWTWISDRGNKAQPIKVIIRVGPKRAIRNGSQPRLIIKVRADGPKGIPLRIQKLHARDGAVEKARQAAKLTKCWCIHSWSLLGCQDEEEHNDAVPAEEWELLLQ